MIISHTDPTGQVITDTDLDPTGQVILDPGGSRSATLVANFVLENFPAFLLLQLNNHRLVTVLYMSENLHSLLSP